MSSVRPMSGGSGLDAVLARIATLRALTHGPSFAAALGAASSTAAALADSSPSTTSAAPAATSAALGTAGSVADRPVAWPPSTTTMPGSGTTAGTTGGPTATTGTGSGSATTDTGAATGWYAALPAAGEPWAAMIEDAASAAGVDPALLGAVVWTESGFRADAVSPAGAVGLTQLMPDTAASLGVDATDPDQNLAGGARLLRSLIDRYGDPTLALAAYNAGPGRVDEAGGVPAIAETQQFVTRVTGRWAQLAASARTAPTDGRVPSAGTASAAAGAPALSGATPAIDTDGAPL